LHALDAADQEAAATVGIGAVVAHPAAEYLERANPDHGERGDRDQQPEQCALPAGHWSVGGYFGTVYTRVLRVGVAGGGARAMAGNTPSPSLTRAKMVYMPSRLCAAAKVMKNCDPLLLGSLVRAMPTTPAASYWSAATISSPKP